MYKRITRCPTCGTSTTIPVRYWDFLAWKGLDSYCSPYSGRDVQCNSCGNIFKPENILRLYRWTSAFLVGKEIRWNGNNRWHLVTKVWDKKVSCPNDQYFVWDADEQGYFSFEWRQPKAAPKCICGESH